MPKIQLGGLTPTNPVVEQKEEEVVLAKTPEELVELEQQIRDDDLKKEHNLQAIQRKRRRKNALMTALVVLLFLGLIGFGTYGTFFKKTMSRDDVIKIISETSLAKELFPGSDVEGYLRQNINGIFEGYLSVAGNNSMEYARPLPDTLYVTRVNKRNERLANVQFAVAIKTKEVDTTDFDGNVIPGKETEEYYNFLVPIRFDTNARVFSLAGKPELSVTPVQGVPREVEISEMLSFNGIEELDQNKTASAKEFIDTFLRTLYNSNSSIATFTNSPRESFVINGQTFVAITDFHIYQADNLSGLNSFCDFTVQTDAGFTYNTRLYFKLENITGGSWIIQSIF